MKRSVQILLMMVFLVPLPSQAKEETMVERRQRIMRKYLRERSNISQSEIEVPFARPEDDDLAKSEQFKESQVSLQRNEGGSPMPPPPPPRRPRPTAGNRNWLLAVDPMQDDADSEKTPKKQKDWSIWGMDREQSPYGGTQRNGFYDRRTQEDSSANSSRDGSRQKGLFNSRGYTPFSSGRDSSGFQRRESIPGGGYSGIFGRKRDEPSGSGLGTLDLSRDRIYNPALNQGRLKSPFQRESTPSADRSFGSGFKGQGYTPYKSPYETQRKQQQQPWGGQTQQGPEYKKVDTYQEWKKRNPVRYDPTGDDAFINEVMPKSRR